LIGAIKFFEETAPSVYSLGLFVRLSFCNIEVHPNHAPTPKPHEPNVIASASDDVVHADMQRWLERAVIGLNLCPFAKAVHVKQQIHYATTRATDDEAVLQALANELAALLEIDPEVRSTTMLMVPDHLADFLDFNDFLGLADALIEDMGLESTMQIASFHPQYQFADTAPDDITNYTNRAPYPTLHLLRQDSVDRAVDAFPEAENIFGANIETLEKLGLAGWNALDVGARASEASSE
jgi:uncharacterized protein